MTNEQEHLTPETIDEQIEWLQEQLQALPLDAPRTPEMQVIQALQEEYAEERRADAGSLAATWDRLAARYEATAYSQPQPALSLVQMRPNDERSFPMNIKKKVANWRERGFSRLAVAITLVALVSLVSGLSIGVLLVRLPHASPANVITAVPATPFPPTKQPFPTPQPSATANPPAANFLSSIQMIDAKSGWGLTSKNQVVNTTAGGAAWQDVTPHGLGVPIAWVFLNAKVAWIASGIQAPTGPGDGTTMLFRTTDGGLHWQQNVLAFYVGQMTFVDTQDGWILVGRGIAAGSEGVDIYRTTDGGQTWKLASSASSAFNPGDPTTLPFSGSKSGMAFASPTTGWITGSEPIPDFFYIYETTDGGVTWHHQDLPLPTGVSDVQTYAQQPTFVDDQNGFLRVNFALDSGTQASFELYVTHDGGKSWQVTNLLPASIYDFLDGRQGWATTGTNLWMTTDGAQNWTIIPQSDPFISIQSLDFVSPTLGWALSQPPLGSGLPALLQTTDGGHTWQIVKTTLP